MTINIQRYTKLSSSLSCSCSKFSLDRSYSINSLLETLDVVEVLNPIVKTTDDESVSISYVTTDSRDLVDSDSNACLFIAIEGEAIDGHDYLPSVLKKNVAAIIASNPDKINKLQFSVPVIVVKNTSIALKTLVKLGISINLDQLKLIGITGTNGKTTTAWMIAFLAKELNIKSASIGTLGVVVTTLEKFGFC